MVGKAGADGEEGHFVERFGGGLSWGLQSSGDAGQDPGGRCEMWEALEKGGSREERAN